MLLQSVGGGSIRLAPESISVSERRDMCAADGCPASAGLRGTHSTRPPGGGGGGGMFGTCRWPNRRLFLTCSSSFQRYTRLTKFAQATCLALTFNRRQSAPNKRPVCLLCLDKCSQNTERLYHQCRVTEHRKRCNLQALGKLLPRTAETENLFTQ